MTVCQKVPKSYFQSQFWMSKINQIFSKKKILSQNINLGMEVSIDGGRTRCQFFLFQKLKEILTRYSRTILKASKN